MAGDRFIIALDQGTTSTRAILFDNTVQPRAIHSEPIRQIFPEPGWVEHDPDEIWQSALTCLRRVAGGAGSAAAIAGIGITNQRETTVMWERKSGRPLHNAIVWQDRRTAGFCEVLRKEGLEDHVHAVTGLLLDPYFSATKLAWLLDHVAGARARAERGELCFGTIDSWLIWNLTGGSSHVSDASNAARTLLYDISEGTWDEMLLERLAIPPTVLPKVSACRGRIAETTAEILGLPVAILSSAGDQQAAAFGQACFAPGDIKATYGTGCFVLVNTGSDQLKSQNRLLATIGCQDDISRTFALEGSVFMAGATIQWLRDQLGLFEDAARTEEIAARADPASGVVLVPAFAGLGAPHWRADARGTICGLTRGAGAPEIVRAGLEAVVFQTRDLLSAMVSDLKSAGLAGPRSLRVDGGMARNDWMLQFLADQLAMPVERSANVEATALGVALMAGLEAGILASMDDISAGWRAERVFEPAMSGDERDNRYRLWQDAIRKVLA